MNAHHLSRNATTVFESLEDAGLTAAAVNTPATGDGRGTFRPCPGSCARWTAPPLLLLQPLRVGRHRCAAGDQDADRWVDRRLRCRGRPMARDAGRLRLPLLLPARLRLRLSRARPRRRRGGSGAQRPGRGLLVEAAGGWTSSCSATPSSCARITARPTSIVWRDSRTGSATRAWSPRRTGRDGLHGQAAQGCRAACA